MSGKEKYLDKKSSENFWITTPAKVRTGTGKTTSDWRVLDLFQGSDGFILALKNLCRDRQSHHGVIAQGDANSLC